MWTAWFVAQLEPQARVVLVEAERCGAGPSGRNGGFVNEMWFSLPTLRRRFGDSAALEVARAAEGGGDGRRPVVRGAGRRRLVFAGPDTSRSRPPPPRTAPGARWSPPASELGVPEVCRPLTDAEVRARCDSPLFRAGAFYPGAATVHPARLALGLRSTLSERGVRVFEGTRADPPRRDGGHLILDARTGRVRAGSVVLACGPALAGHRPLRHRLTVTSSHMVVTEPVPDVLDELGWTGGECITDSRHAGPLLPHHARRRIAFGWGGGRVVRADRLSGRAEVDPGVVAEVERSLVRFFPALAGRRIEHAWVARSTFADPPPDDRKPRRRSRPLRLRLHGQRGRALASRGANPRLAGARPPRRAVAPGDRRFAAWPRPSGAAALLRRDASSAGRSCGGSASRSGASAPAL